MAYTYAQNTPNDPHIINVNDDSKWDTSGLADDYPTDQEVDSSVPGSWKANNGTNCWDHSPQTVANTSSDRFRQDPAITARPDRFSQEPILTNRSAFHQDPPTGRPADRFHDPMNNSAPNNSFYQDPLPVSRPDRFHQDPLAASSPDRFYQNAPQAGPRNDGFHQNQNSMPTSRPDRFVQEQAADPRADRFYQDPFANSRAGPDRFHQDPNPISRPDRFHQEQPPARTDRFQVPTPRNDRFYQEPLVTTRPGGGGGGGGYQQNASPAQSDYYRQEPVKSSRPDYIAPDLNTAPKHDSGVLIEIVPYDPNWAIKFEEESNRLKATLGPELVVTVHHIGSTSVSGLVAKPIIDMIPVVKNILEMDSPLNRAKMQALGYEYKGEGGIPFRRFYTKNDLSGTRRTHHLHVYQFGNPEIEHHLEFRNYLNSPAGRQNDLLKYAQLKMELAAVYPNDMKSYSLGKSNFITRIQSKLNFGGILFRNCYTDEEWIGYKKLMRHEEPILSVNHFQFVLLYRFEIVCAAQVIMNRDYFNILDIQTDEKWLGHGFDLKMEQNLMQWSSHQHFLMNRPT